MAAIVLLFLIGYGVSRPPEVPPEGDVEYRIEAVATEYAPDRRTTVFAVSYSLEGNRLYLDGRVMTAEQKAALTESLRTIPGVGRIYNEVQVLAGPEGSPAVTAVVNATVANVYQEADAGSELITQAVLGDAVRVLGQDNSLSQVQMDNGYIGWVLDRDLAVGEAARLYAEQVNTQVTAALVPIHQSPDPAAPILVNATAGSPLAAAETSGAWVKLVLPDGRTGWIRSAMVQARTWPLAVAAAGATLPGNAPAIVRTANRWLGVSYYWGGTSSLGLDCSGLTQLVYRLNGIILPRDSDQQYAVGEPVAIDQMAPGDLIFFAASVPAERPTHVGIYLGQNRFIHASAGSGKVVTGSLKQGDTGYQASLAAGIFGARRIIQAGK